MHQKIQYESEDADERERKSVHSLFRLHFKVFCNHATISAFQCCCSGARQLLIPWPPASTVIRSQTLPVAFMVAHIVVDWSNVTWSSFVPWMQRNGGIPLATAWMGEAARSLARPASSSDSAPKYRMPPPWAKCWLMLVILKRSG